MAMTCLEISGQAPDGDESDDDLSAEEYLEMMRQIEEAVIAEILEHGAVIFRAQAPTSPCRPPDHCCPQL